MSSSAAAACMPACTGQACQACKQSKLQIQRIAALAVKQQAHRGLTCEKGERSVLPLLVPMPMVASDQTMSIEKTPSTTAASLWTQGASRHLYSITLLRH